MSATFTLPLSSAEHFSHGRANSQPRAHQRSRTSSRLAPPFPLPRIPSESMPQPRQYHKHEPSQDLYMDAHEEKDEMANHSHAHTHTHTPNLNLIPTPRLEPTGQALRKLNTFPSRVEMRNTADAYRQSPRTVSKPTDFLLHTTESYSLMHGILADNDSRKIFYFMCLNLAFMVVQSTYGYLTGSLGLISDSIHMFFDCVALFVGICAVVMSKWPASVKFPYGYGKIDTLAGFANGVFLLLISVEIVYEAVERLFSGAEISRTNELLVVSTTGLLVNLVGLLAMGHHHHGHSHGHSHGHHHSHDHHQHEEKHDHTEGHTPYHTPTQSIVSASVSPKTKSANAGGHSHGGENMQGIYLHIIADAMGSVAVILSTILAKLTGWSGWDPIAATITAILIFLSALPLVSSTAKILLLSMNSDIEYNLRDILGGVSEIRGVVGYTVPKFWLEDTPKKVVDHHGHDHGHDHSHDHQEPHHHHSHSDDSCKSHSKSDDPAVLGVIHIIAGQHAELNDVRERVSRYFDSKNMDIIVQVEREGENRCWCGGGLKTT
jgi:solute carrier family 30 (zinc transporter), member 5/7